MRYVTILAAILYALGASAGERVHMTVGRVTYAPSGWPEFCQTYPDMCARRFQLGVPVITLTHHVMRQLQRINTQVNTSIVYQRDSVHWGVDERWNLGEDHFGDCEDYALRKQLVLALAGYPRGSLLVTYVTNETKEGHAVLTVVTNRGDFILDSVRDEILLWNRVPYTFISRQSQADPNVWVSLVPAVLARVH